MYNMRGSTDKPFKHANLLTHQHLHLHSQTLLVYAEFGLWTDGQGQLLALEFLNSVGWIQIPRNNSGLACQTDQPVKLVGSWSWSRWSHSVQKPGMRWGLAVPSTAGPDWWWWQWRLARMNRASHLHHLSLARCPQCSSQHLLTHTPEEEMSTIKFYGPKLRSGRAAKKIQTDTEKPEKKAGICASVRSL